MNCTKLFISERERKAKLMKSQKRDSYMLNVSKSRSRGGKGTQITITSCECPDDSAVIDSSHTEGRLPSITEMSEQSTTPETRSEKRITFPRESSMFSPRGSRGSRGSTTPSSGKDR